MIERLKAILGLDSSNKGVIENAFFWGREVNLVYYSPNNEEVSERRVKVKRVWVEGGKSYFKGYCSLRGEARSFRVDRIISVERA